MPFADNASVFLLRIINVQAVEVWNIEIILSIS